MDRIAAALERIAPAPLAAPDFGAASAFVWHTEPDRLEPVAKVSRVDLGLLVGVDRARDTLLANTRQLTPFCFSFFVGRRRRDVQTTDGQTDEQVFSEARRCHLL